MVTLGHSWLQLAPDGVADEGDMLGIVSLLQTLVDEGEVAEDGVHRHHPPAHGRHHHRVHPWTLVLKYKY